MVDVLSVAFPKQVVEGKFRGHEEALNGHLVKLLAFDVPEETRAVWRREIRTHLRYLAALRLKPNARPVPTRDIRRWLYSDPFVGNEVGYTSALIGLFADDFRRNDAPPAAIAAQIAAFWDRTIPGLARGTPKPPQGFDE